jgi:hypothetical protein
MDDNQASDMARALMVDGNAVAGVLQEIFGIEMTANPAECASCGQASELGGLRAYTQAPGAVLRCPVCEAVVLTIVQTPDAIYLDTRGAAYLKLRRNG